MKQIIDGRLYDTEKAELVTSNHFWDGSNWERDGRNTYLYKTTKGAFFLHHTTLWQGCRDSIVTLTESEARAHYEHLPEYEMTYVEAFGEEPEEA